MVSAITAAKRMFEALLAGRTPEELLNRQRPDTKTPLKPWLRPSKRLDPKFTAAHWRTLLAHTDATAEDARELLDARALELMQAYAHNIENYAGVVRVPMGVVGPLRVNGLFAKGDFYIPLATTEAALVASYGRGARLVSLAGGCSVALMAEGVQRSPAFAFSNVGEAGVFVAWVLDNRDVLKTAAQATTRHGVLLDIAPHIEGANVYLICSYTTGDASGQNMATIATEALCQAIITGCPITPQYWFVEGNFSGDKKASSLSFLHVRGRKVTASVELTDAMIQSHLHTTAERMESYWRMSALGGVMSGSIGVQGHYANGIAALFIATGQDAACVAEAAVGVTRIERRAPDRLFVAVTLPNIIVGTVGGGSGLPSQSAGLRILGLHGEGKARAFAEVVASVCLAGELSIIGAMCAHEFAGAHRKLARGE